MCATTLEEQGSFQLTSCQCQSSISHPLHCCLFVPLKETHHKGDAIQIHGNPNQAKFFMSLPRTPSHHLDHRQGLRFSAPNRPNHRRDAAFAICQVMSLLHSKGPICNIPTFFHLITTRIKACHNSQLGHMDLSCLEGFSVFDLFFTVFRKKEGKKGFDPSLYLSPELSDMIWPRFELKSRYNPNRKSNWASLPEPVQ
jgi:hypothetical protein